MQILILAAGYGTRLYPLTLNIPKPLLDCSGQPIINYLLDKVKHSPDLKDILVVTNEKFHLEFESWAKDNKDFPVPIRIVNDGTTSPDNRLGALGDIEFVIKKGLISDDLVVIGGDNMFNASLSEFLKFSKSKDPRITMGCFDIKDLASAKKFGVLQIDDTSKILSFEEKPPQPKSSLIAMCLYYFPKASLPLISEFLNSTHKGDTTGGYIQWLYKRDIVFGFKFSGKWYDIGSLESYQEAQKDFSITQ